MALWSFGPVAELLQAAAFDPEAWPEALDALSRSVGGAGALAARADQAPDGPPLISPDLEEMSQDYFRGGWGRREERYALGSHILLRKGSLVDQDFTTPEKMDRSAYYQDFISRHDRRWFLALAFDVGDGETWMTSIQRTARQGPFLPEEVERAKTLVRALSDAASFSRRLGFARVSGLVEAMELVGRPCLVLDDNGCVIGLNALADGLVGSLMDVKSRTLAFGEPTSEARFNAALKAALAPPTEPAQSTVASVRDRAGALHVVRIASLRADFARFSFANARALVIFERQILATSAAAAALSAAFGLTPAEARLAFEMRSGASLREVARRNGVTYETARTYLKSVFLKTGARRQGELAALVAQCC